MAASSVKFALITMNYMRIKSSIGFICTIHRNNKTLHMYMSYT